MDAFIEKQLDTFDHHIKDGDIDYETKSAVKNWLYKQDVEIHRVVRNRSLKHHIQSFVSKEHERARVTADTIDETPYEEPREQDLCTCEDSDCTLKQGRLPPAIRMADNPSDGVREFEQMHNGDPVVLRQAREELNTLSAEVGELLLTANIALVNGVAPWSVESTTPAKDEKTV